METVVGIFYLVLIGYVIFRVWKKRQGEQSEFDLVTVNEKFEIAKRTNDSLHNMEQLITELDICSAERQIVIQIAWLGEDEETHAEDIFCNGKNTATECMKAIAEREAYDLRNALAYQCEALAKCTRHRKNGRQNDYTAIGEWLDEAV